MKKLKIWFNACEVSGDVQASLLLKQLLEIYPNLEVLGMGGDQLEALGQKNLFHVSELSVMGITEIISAIPKILKLKKNIISAIQEEKPDVVILVDSGEFNFPIAKAAKKAGIPVFYFIPPKVWAWRQYRIKYLKKYVDKILCILPFEVDYYKSHGIDAQYIENPLYKALLPYKAKQYNKDEDNTINFAIMPGSRRKEVVVLLPFFAKVAKELHKKYPNSKFSIIKAQNFSVDYLSSLWNTSTDLPAVDYVQSNDRYEALANSHFCLAASGTATLETALIRLPTTIAYQISKISEIVIKTFITIKFAGLASLIVNHEIFPEYLQAEMTVDNIVNKITSWIDNPNELDKLEEEFDLLARLIASDDTELRIFDSL